MIVDYLKNSKYYNALGENFSLAFSLLAEAETQSVGRYQVNDELYYMVQQYVCELDKNNFEKHEKYIDVQYIADGAETIEVNDASRLNLITPYDQQKDVMFLEGKGTKVTLTEGMFMVLFPCDAHAPAIRVNDAPVKKIIVKIKV